MLATRFFAIITVAPTNCQVFQCEKFCKINTGNSFPNLQWQHRPVFESPASEILVHYAFGPAYIGHSSGHRRPVHALERVYRDYPELSAAFFPKDDNLGELMSTVYPCACEGG